MYLIPPTVCTPYQIGDGVEYALTYVRTCYKQSTNGRVKRDGKLRLNRLNSLPPPHMTCFSHESSSPSIRGSNPTRASAPQSKTERTNLVHPKLKAQIRWALGAIAA